MSARPAQSLDEPIIDLQLPILDAHHHLWFQSQAELAALEAQDSIIARSLAPTYRRYARYLLDEFLEDARSGHNVYASVFCQCHAMYRANGPEAKKSVGEVEFVNGVAAMATSGAFGEVQACAGIVGGADLRLGAAIAEVLAAQIQAGGNRYRGVRATKVIYDDDVSILGAGTNAPHVLMDPRFREGFMQLAPLNLSCDILLLEPQLPELIDLARSFPETSIILNHVGVPLGLGRYAGKREERFPIWRSNILDLAKCQNVTVKLSGLGIAAPGFKSYRANPPFTSEQLAAEWRPYIETCIEAFGATRCMFGSNFPVDSATCSYPVLWNTFKRIVSGASTQEKTALFGGTAKKVYRLEVGENLGGASRE